MTLMQKIFLIIFFTSLYNSTPAYADNHNEPNNKYQLFDSLILNNKIAFKEYCKSYPKEIQAFLAIKKEELPKIELNEYLGIISIYQRNFEAAEIHFLNALSFCEENSDSLKMHLNISWLYRRMKTYSKAMEQVNLSYSHVKGYDDRLHLNLELSRIYRENKEPDFYKESIKKCKEFSKVAENKNILASFHYEYATHLIKNEEYNLAINHLKIGEPLLIETGRYVSLSRLYDLLGSLYFFKKYYIKSKKYYLKAKIQNEKLDNKRGLAISYNNLGNLYLNTNQKRIASLYFDTSKTIAIEAQDIGLLKTIMTNKIDALQALNDDKSTIKEFQSYIEIIDSLNILKKESEYLDLQTQYQTKEIEQEKKLIAQRYFYSLIALSFFLLSTGIISFLFRRTKKQNKIITNQNQELEKLNSFKNQLFSIMGHDMRGMMSKLNLSQRKILRTNHKEGNDSLEKPISKMGAIIDGLNGFIENILYWGFTQTDKLHFNFETLHVNQIIDQVVLNFKYDLEAKELKIIKNIDADFNILADMNTTKVVLRNLIANAIKFSENGKEITIEAKENKEFHTIKVIDQGVGISNKILPRIFETNPEKINDGTMGEKGTGLGLWLCQEMMEKNQGKISVESEEGKGTCFILQFPKSTS